MPSRNKKLTQAQWDKLPARQLNSKRKRMSLVQYLYSRRVCRSGCIAASEYEDDVVGIMADLMDTPIDGGRFSKHWPFDLGEKLWKDIASVDPTLRAGPTFEEFWADPVTGGSVWYVHCAEERLTFLLQMLDFLNVEVQAQSAVAPGQRKFSPVLKEVLAARQAWLEAFNRKDAYDRDASEADDMVIIGCGRIVPRSDRVAAFIGPADAPRLRTSKFDVQSFWVRDDMAVLVGIHGDASAGERGRVATSEVWMRDIWGWHVKLIHASELAPAKPE